MSKITTAAVKYGKQKLIPATILDVVGPKCSVALSGNGKILRGLSYFGPVPVTGQVVQVDYASGKPIVQTASGAVAVTPRTVSGRVFGKTSTDTGAVAPSISHNDLMGLQGGAPTTEITDSEYYHLSHDEYDALGLGTGSPPSVGGGHAILDEGILLPTEPDLDFAGAGVTVTDVPGSTKTLVTIPGGAGVANLGSTDETVGGSKADGSAETAARSDHKHGITNPKLDDLATPDNNTDLNSNTTNHGLLLKATAPSSGLSTVPAIENGETIWKLKALFDSTNPAANGTAAPGTSLIAARRDHVHAAYSLPSNVSTFRARGFVAYPQSWYVVQPQIPIFRADADVHITRIEIHGNDSTPTTELFTHLKYATDMFYGSFAGATTIDNCQTTSGKVVITTGFDVSAVPSGKYVYLEMDASPHVDWTSFYIEVYYTYD